MSISTLPECAAPALSRGVAARGVVTHGASRGVVLALSLLLVALLPAPTAEAQAAGARRAIEKLEKCSDKERKSGCIDILKVERGKGDKQAIKAQVRGGRIIWYEYDRKSGRVRRTN